MGVSQKQSPFKIGSILEAGVFLLGFLLFLLFFAPALTKMLDEVRYEKDVLRAEALTRVIHNEGLPFSEPVETHELRTWLIAQDDTPKLLVPQARNSAFFYDAHEGVVKSLTYEEAAENYLNQTKITAFSNPCEIFGEGLLLLSTEGNRVAEDVFDVYQMVEIKRRPEPVLLKYWKDIQQTLERWLERTVYQEESNTLWSHRHQAFLAHYHPSTTLFVSNMAWYTQANTGEEIQSIVFEPGISHIPMFDLGRFQPDSIVFDEVVLPKTVRSVAGQAFSEVFSISLMTVAGYPNLRFDTDAFIGVDDITWTPITTAFDSAEFEIDVMFEGRPLIVYNLATVRETLSLDLRHVRHYFQSLDIEVLHYNIVLNLNDMTKTRVYVYTQEGYFGYIVPHPE